MKVTKSIILFLFDLVVIYLAYYISFLILFEGVLDSTYLYLFKSTAVFALLIYLISFLAFRTYSRRWRYSSLLDVAYQLTSIVFGTGALLLFYLVFLKTSFISPSVILINAIILSFAILTSRFIYRFIREELAQIFSSGRKKVLIIGAGDAGALLLEDIKRAMSDKYKVVGFLDDNPNKIGTLINGVKVISGVDDLPRIAKKMKIEEVFVAIPSATCEQIGRIIRISNTARLQIKVIPATREILDGDKVFVSQLKPFDFKELLGRDPAVIEEWVIRKAIKDKRVVVTGAAGTIGLELCSRILKFQPQALMLLERDETRIFCAMNLLRERFNNIDIRSVICDVVDQHAVERAFADFKPDIVLHAAAYKHVPLGEENPVSFIENNVFGTVNLINVCEKCAIEKLVFISTDKAVEPVSIMGATKRICEEFIKSFSKTSSISFVIVRFGNVLGSSGSVIEVFEEQAKNNRPITLTSKKAKRFFMTIEETVALSLEVASIGKNADIYVLDMGSLIKLADFAQEMLNLLQSQSPIVITGLRRGDKLEEKLHEDKEVLVKTKFDKVLLVTSKDEPISLGFFLEWLKQLKEVLTEYKPRDRHNLDILIKKIVPNYLPYSEYIENVEEL